MWDNMQVFFYDKMRIPRSDLSERDLECVRRVLTARGRKSRLELLVKFVDVETRDRISSYARNLGKYIEKGKATVTFRHNIPAHLAGVHCTLMQYGHDMAKKHGRGFRRNVRFDDSAMSFCIDVYIPGSNNDEWITVPYDKVCEDRRKKQLQEASRHGSVLSTQGEPMPADDEMDDADSVSSAGASGLNGRARAESNSQPGFSFEKQKRSAGPSWGSRK